MSNYFYSRIQQEGQLYDAERDLLAIAKFLVGSCYETTVPVAIVLETRSCIGPVASQSVKEIH